MRRCRNSFAHPHAHDAPSLYMYTTPATDACCPTTHRTSNHQKEIQINIIFFFQSPLLSFYCESEGQEQADRGVCFAEQKRKCKKKDHVSAIAADYDMSTDDELPNCSIQHVCDFTSSESESESESISESESASVI